MQPHIGKTCADLLVLMVQKKQKLERAVFRNRWKAAKTDDLQIANFSNLF